MGYLLTLFFLLSSTITFAQNAHWKKVSSGEVEVWLHQENSDITASKEERTLPKDLDFSSFDNGQAVKDYENTKQQTLKIIGIRDWKIDEHQWRPIKDGFKLTVTGRYKDARKNNIEFLETYIYKKRHVTQYLLTWPASVKDGSKNAQDFLKSLGEF